MQVKAWLQTGLKHLLEWLLTAPWKQLVMILTLVWTAGLPTILLGKMTGCIALRTVTPLLMMVVPVAPLQFRSCNRRLWTCPTLNQPPYTLTITMMIMPMPMNI